MKKKSMLLKKGLYLSIFAIGLVSIGCNKGSVKVNNQSTGEIAIKRAPMLANGMENLMVKDISNDPISNATILLINSKGIDLANFDQGTTYLFESGEVGFTFKSKNENIYIDIIIKSSEILLAQKFDVKENAAFVNTNLLTGEQNSGINPSLDGHLSMKYKGRRESTMIEDRRHWQWQWNHLYPWMPVYDPYNP